MQPKEGTKEHPAPLDGFARAKPDEPIFTLQGGDPTAGPLVRLWANLARVRAGVLSYDALEEFLWGAANQASNAKELEERKQQGLLIRARSAEEISWQMDEYRKGTGEEPEENAGSEPVEQRLIDLYDYRRRCVARLNNSIAELCEMEDELTKREFLKNGNNLYIEGQLHTALQALKRFAERLEVKRA